MKVIKHRLGDFEQLQILPLADLHIGDLHSDGNKILEWLTYIENTDNCFTILNGDLMDTATRTSVGAGVYQAALQPMEQLNQCVKLFGKIASAGKVLAVCGGNHESRVFKQDGLDTTQMMCNQLGLGELYSPTSAIVFVQFGDQGSHRNYCPMLYTIYCTHGSGAGGRLEGGKLNRLAQLANIIDADIYVHSHTHTPMIMRNSYYRVDTRKCTSQKVDRLFVNTSASLDYSGSYGEFFSYKPNSLETPMILLDGRKRGMRAVL